MQSQRDLTQKPEGEENLVEEMMKQRREEDKRRQPNKTNIDQVRKDIHSALKWRKKYESQHANATTDQLLSASKTAFPDLAAKYPSLLDLAMKHMNENEFKHILNTILERLGAVQQGVMSIQNCTDTVEWDLGKRFVTKKPDN